MKTWKVTALISVPTPGAQFWNGTAFETGTRQQHVNTVVVAADWFQAKAMVEAQFGSNLIGNPVILEG